MLFSLSLIVGVGGVVIPNDFATLVFMDTSKSSGYAPVFGNWVGDLIILVISWPVCTAICCGVEYTAASAPALT